MGTKKIRLQLYDQAKCSCIRTHKVLISRWIGSIWRVFEYVVIYLLGGAKKLFENIEQDLQLAEKKIAISFSELEITAGVDHTFGGGLYYHDKNSDGSYNADYWWPKWPAWASPSDMDDFSDPVNHWDVDTTPPTITITSPLSITYDATVPITLNGDANYHWYYVEPVDQYNHTWTTTEERTLLEGVYTLHAFGNDSVGNVRHTQVTFSVDVTPPNVIIASPTNSTYNENSIILTYSVSDGVVTILIDGTANATVLPSGSKISGFSDGFHNISIIAEDSVGNIGKDTILFTIDITPPSITILNPINSSTYSTNNVWLNFTIDEPASWIGYSLDSAMNETIFFYNFLLSSLSEGPHDIVIFANDTTGNMVASATIWLTIDTILPEITLISPINTSYTTPSLWLNFTISEISTWIGYSLDRAANVTITGNIILDSLAEGSHYIFVFASDVAGNVGASSTVWLTIDSEIPYITLISPINTTMLIDGCHFSVDI